MTLASLLVKVTLTLVLALAGARLARHHRAAVRHLLLAAAFAVILALPVLSVALPTVRVEVPMAANAAAVLSSIDPVAFESAPETIVPMGAAAGEAPAVLARRSGLSIATVLVVIWMAGTSILLAFTLSGLWRLRAIRRSALPWRDGQSMVDGLAADLGVRRRVALLLVDSPRGPMTCGVRRPAVVLPMTAASWAPADLHRALVHELEHVRRRDWLGQCCARVLCAVYWFHPLIWAANRQLVLEAERACDDAVLRRSEAIEYASQLVELARTLSGLRPHAVLGMANRTALETRVRAVLDLRQRRGRAGALWIGIAALATLALVMAISPLRIVAVSAQAASTEKFEVVSIKRCADEPLPPTGAGGRATGPSNASLSPGHAYWACVTIDQLIQTAYANVDTRLLNSLTRQRPGDPQMVRKGPSWIYTEKYEIEAKAAGATPPRTMTGAMLRAFLEERFSLKTHRESEERSMYVLTVAKGGLKIKPTQPGDCWAYDPDRQSAPPPDMADKPSCGNLRMNWNAGNRTLTATGQDMQAFTDGLLSGSLLDRFVINKTGLTGRYNIPLEFAPDDRTPGRLSGLEYSRREGATPPTAPDLFKALELLGLKLEPTKAPAEYLVIDRIERPVIR